jgi:hypothetical protein
MPTRDPERLERLLAEALAVHDERGEAGLAAFLREHAADRAALERALACCRQLGMLGAAAAPAAPRPAGPEDRATGDPTAGPSGGAG